MNRILALALALFIGSPNCWCCVSVRAALDAAPRASCCVSAGNTSGTCPMIHGSDRGSGTGKSCACDSAKAAREVSGTAVSVPSAATLFTVAPAPFSVLLYCGELPHSARGLVMSHGAPCLTGAIFARDCALRL